MGNSTQGNKTIPQMTPISAVTAGMLVHCWDPTQPIGSRDGGLPVSVLVSNAPPAAFGIAMLAWFVSLPTSLPATSGVLWNNGGSLALS